MCLTHIDTFIRPAKIGYKVMLKTEGGFIPSYDMFPAYIHVCIQGNKPILKNKWVNEKEYRLYPAKENLYVPEDLKGKQTYSTGFHCYHKKKDARTRIRLQEVNCEAIVKVAIRKPIATGYQFERKITVAKEIKILEEVR